MDGWWRPLAERAGVTDGLRLDERRFTVHRSARRRDGTAAAGVPRTVGQSRAAAMRQATG